MPHDFRNKSFQKVLRGYATDEVDEYIAYMNDEYRKLERRAADSERKLALALKKLDENLKNASGDSVVLAAREQAARLLKEAEAKRDQMVEYASEIANASADGIIENANARADQIEEEAIQRAEAILAEAKAEAEVHRDDVKNAQESAKQIYREIGMFREKLFALYNEHLDAIEVVTDAARDFLNDTGVSGTEEPAEEEISETEDDLPAEEDEPAAEEFEEEPETAEVPVVPEDETAEESVPEEEAASLPLGEEVASNLAFMDRLFANLQNAEEAPAEDLYIDIPEDDEEEEPEEYVEDDFEDMTESGLRAAAEDSAAEEPAEDELPPITIDWKKRSAVSAQNAEEETELPTVDESTDFRSVDGFDEFEGEEYVDYEEEDFEQNYDEYSPDGMMEDEITAELSGDEEFEEEEEKDEYHDMDQIFNEDKSKREMSITDEFNIIFADSKSSQNVKEISRQPIVTPENPKNAKKHKKF